MLRHSFAIGLGLGILGASSTVFASESGLALGARVGYAIPMGKLGGTTATDVTNHDLADNVTGMVPLWLDVGYRVNPAIYVGGFFQYGFAFVNKDKNTECSQGLSCSTHDIAFGANLHYHILPDATFDPWLGVGLGYEIFTQNASGTVFGQNADGSGTFKGFQFLILEAGGDFKATPDLAVGPFLNFALGQFSTWSDEGSAAGVSLNQSGDVTDSGMHEWLTLGIRGQYDL
jgi:outer membrane protein W